MSASLSVVIPVYNEAAHLPGTIEALVEAVAESGFVADVVLVDDGSTDGSADVVRDALGGRLPLHVVSQPNRGRFEARRSGLDAARGEWVLLVDGRVRLRPASLAFVERRLAAGETVWNGHVHVETDGNPYGAFWNVLVQLAWRDYFDDPRPTSFGAESFDRFPKGTTCFLVSRLLLAEALGRFRSGYADPRYANDDTPLIRWISAQTPIHLSPSFACDYRPRATLRSFLRHSVHRGVVFLDGHGRPESRFFPVVVAFFPLSAGLVVASVRRPLLLPVAGAMSAAAASALALATRRSPFEVASFGALTPLYAVAHGAGMWRGFAMMVHQRLGHTAGT
jgi:glycosyltransferase involved in cell wall biosynthesis